MRIVDKFRKLENIIIITFCPDLADDKLFSADHYDEIGFVRDTCVEVARNLHQALKLLKATKPCAILANTRTSTLWPYCKWNKWTRTGNKEVNNRVMERALAMVKDFNENADYKAYSIDFMYQASSVIKSIDEAITRLTKSGAAKQESDIIREINKLKITYCQNYINHLKQEKQKAEAQERSEALEAPQLAEVQKRQQEEPEVTHRKGALDPSEDHEKQNMTKVVETRLSEETNMNSNNEYPLHESVFNDNQCRLSRLLRAKYDVNVEDIHGNTPLHLAVMLGRRTCIDILLEFGASVRKRNLEGWSPMEEAISFGDRDTIRLLWFRYYHYLQFDLVERRKLLLPQLDRIDDFYMELKWALTTSVPLVSRFGILPSDLCRLYKHGQSVRVDSTFYNYVRFQSVRRDTSILFDGSNPEKPFLYFIDHADRAYGPIGNQKAADDIVKEADEKMCEDIVSFDIPTECLTFTRAKSGWIPFRDYKSEMVGSFMADFYTVHGLELVSIKRREHLSEAQIIKNEEASSVNKLASGLVPMRSLKKQCNLQQESLTPPRCVVSWYGYINSRPGKYPILGRPIVIKEDIMPYQSEVGMAENFPISKELLANILEIVAPFKQFNHLSEFIKAHMPPGFPVKFKIPIMLTISAEYEIQNFEWRKYDEKLFKIPPDYTPVEYSYDDRLFNV